MLFQVDLRSQRIPLEVDVDISLNRRDRQLARSGHFFSHAIEALDAVNHRNKNGESGIRARQEPRRSLLSSCEGSIVERGIDPKNNETGDVGTDEIGGLNEPRKEHL